MLNYGEFIGFHTNLLSEYLALKRALQFALLIDKEIKNSHRQYDNSSTKKIERKN